MTEDLFQDEVVRATDLNRSSGEILNKATHHPVTILRNDEAFALMRRDVAAHWRKEASYAVHLTELLWIALSHPDTLAPEHQWMAAFDAEQTLEMSSELMHAYRKAVRNGSWEEFDALIHEWSESGWAALSSELREAFTAEPEEIPLEAPASPA